MLTKLLGKISRRIEKQWTEQEIRNLIASGELDSARAAVSALHTATPERELRQLCLLGEIAFHSNRDEEAGVSYTQALTQAPGFPEAHYGLSLLKHAQGDLEGAFQHALFAKNSAPADPRYLSQLGLCHIAIGNLPQAEELLRHALQNTPNDKSAWNNLGISLLSKGQISEARACFLNAIKLDQKFLLARQNLEQLNSDTSTRELSDKSTRENNDTLDHFLNANSSDALGLLPEATKPPPAWHTTWENVRGLATEGQREKAFAAVERLLIEQPNVAELAVLADRLYRNLGEADSGLAVLQAFLVRQPDSAVAQQGMGEALLQWADYANGEIHLRRASALGADNQRLLHALGQALFKLDRYVEALPIFEQCQQRWPSNINLAKLALAHYNVCDYNNALICLEELLSAQMIDRLGLQFVYAQTLAYAGRIEDALPIMDSEINRMGNAPALRVNRAFMHLLLEDFGPGWDGYRYRQLGLRAYRVLPIPEWKGESLTGKTIIVLAEQGLGDQIMFASCLPDLKALGPDRIIVEAVDRVAPTLARSFPECEFIATKQDKKMAWVRELGQVDYFIPLADLPRQFRRNLHDFPGKAYLKPAPERILYWRAELQKLGPGPYIGTSWRGGTEQTRKIARTLSPELLRPLITALPSQWISLQYGKVEEELEKAAKEGIQLKHWPEAIANLDEFAALIAALDGVFTVCNTTVHYAGAVGQRTWVLAPSVPEWRYGLRNRSMPWYPNVTVLRQPRPSAWSEVIDSARACFVDNYRHHIAPGNDK